LPECSTVEDEITKIRHEFELAKQRFLNIPEAINSMPKMNPQGEVLFAIDFGFVIVLLSH